MEVPRLEVEPELQHRAYVTATATQDLSTSATYTTAHCRILNPLSEARDPTHNLMVPSQIRFHGSTTGIPHVTFLKS